MNNNTKWHLNPKIFIEVTNEFVYPEIDISLPEYIQNFRIMFSRSFEPEAKAVDDFLIGWSKPLSYIFPPLSLRKVRSKGK